MNAFLDWVLPMNCNWFILWCILAVVATILAWCWTASDNTTSELVNGVRVEHYHGVYAFSKGVFSLAVTVIALSVFVWLIYSASRDLEVEHEERIEIKPVKYPDGKVVQMFTCNDKNYNCNSLYSCSPPEGSYIRRVVYKKVYVGVYWPANRVNRRSSNDDAFFLVTPNGVDKKADKMEPATN
jgi:hypothetical protein